MQSIQSIPQLEESIAARPNSIEVNQALADAYFKQGRWEEAARAYQSLASLYPATAMLFVNRIRLGATALALSSLCILAAEMLQPSIAPDGPGFASAVSSRGYFAAQALFLLAFPLLSTAAISIYKLLSYSPDHRPAFWAMVCSVLGVGLSMPGLGINMVILPAIGRLYLQGQAGVLNLQMVLREFPWSGILRSGNFLLGLGIVTFAWLIWRNKDFPKWGVSLLLAGWMIFILSGNQLSRAGLLFAGLLIGLGGVELARNLWVQAPLQFRPAAAATPEAGV